MKHTHLKTTALVLAVAGSVLLLAGCGADRQSVSTAAGSPIAVKTAVIEPVAFDEVYEAPGTVRARRSATIASKVVGYIQEMRVNAGDRVRAGQVLAVLAAQDLDAQVARATAARLAAQSAVLEAEKARAAAQSGAAFAEATYQRYQMLLDKRAISRQEFEEAESRYKSAVANQEMAAAAIARARAGQGQAEAELEGAKVMRGYAVLSAPFAGVISEKRMDAGSLAMPGQPLLILEQAGDFRLEATVEESRIAAVQLGDQVRVAVEALGTTVEGRVSEIVPAVDAASRAFLVKIDLPGGAALRDLRSGQFGRAAFRIGRRQAMSVPEAAVRRYGQLQSVFVSENGTARQRLVTLGPQSGGRVEVLSGLNPGERVVVTNVAALRDGARLEEARP